MTARRLVILSVVVLLLFAFILLFERKLPSTEDRQREGELHWNLPEDSIDEIRLEQSGGSIRLKKQGEDWRIVEPESYPADPAAVSDLTAQLGDLKRSEGEGEGARAEDYGLQPPSAKATVFWTDEKTRARQQKTVELGLEIPGTDFTAARVESGGPVVFVPSSVSSAVRKNVADLRSKELFGGSAFDTSRLEIARGSGRLVLARKGGAWWLEQPVADLASTEEAEELAGDLAALRVQDFVTGPERENLVALGLAPPLYRVTVTGTKGKAVTVELGSTRSEGNAVYGRREGQVFTVDNSIVEDLSREGEAFRSTQLVRFDRADVTGVEGAFGTSKYALSQKEGGWTMSGKPVLASAADDILTAILDLKSRAVLEPDAAQTQTPAGEVRVGLSNGERWEIKLLSRTGGVTAVVGRRPGAFELAADVPSRLQSVFQKAAQAPAPTPTAPPAKKP
jgi:hypothetical protein